MDWPPYTSVVFSRNYRNLTGVSVDRVKFYQTVSPSWKRDFFPTSSCIQVALQAFLTLVPYPIIFTTSIGCLDSLIVSSVKRRIVINWSFFRQVDFAIILKRKRFAFRNYVRFVQKTINDFLLPRFSTICHSFVAFSHIRNSCTLWYSWISSSNLCMTISPQKFLFCELSEHCAPSCTCS